jgi:isoleucyl-tRNA synthetase
VREPGVAGAADSVHLCDYPSVDAARIDRDVEAAMAAVRSVVVLGRALREKHKLKTRQPLARVTVVTHDARVRALLWAQQALIADELNVKDVVVVNDDATLASLSFKANFKTLGKRAGPKMKAIAAVIEKFDRAAWAVLEAGGAVDVEGEAIGRDDVLVTRAANGDVVLSTEGALTVALDTALTDALVDEGLVREVTSRLQQARKDAGCALTDRVELTLTTLDARLKAVITGAAAEIADEVLATAIVVDAPAVPPVIGEPVDVNGVPLWVELKKV